MTNPDMKWRDAIITVLQDADGAMHYTEVAEEIAKRKLRKKSGRNPCGHGSINGQHVQQER